MTTDSDSIVRPDSEEKLLLVKCGLRTKSCTQSRTPRTSSFLMAKRSTLTINFSPRVAGSRVTSAVNWNTWNVIVSRAKQTTFKSAKQHAWLDTINLLYKCWGARKPTCAEQNDRTSPTSWRLLVDDRSSCHRSCTKEWYSALHASTSLPLVHPFSRSPSKILLDSWKGGTSSPPTTVDGHKQLIPCRMSDLKATVDSKQFTNSSRKERAPRQNSVHKYWPPTLPSEAITRVPGRKSFSSIAGNRK